MTIPGLPENVREAYSIIYHNYTSRQGAIHLVGSSEGRSRRKALQRLPTTLVY